MKLPALRQATDAAVHLSHVLGADGGVNVLVVIKARYSVTLAGKVSRSRGEVRLADELWDEGAPEASSLKYASDLCLHKPATDVLVKADAMAPGTKPQTALDVLVRVGVVERALRVFGNRIWYKGALGLSATPPQPFERMPLKWELAFGGRDTASGKLVEEPRNPVGRGFVANAASLVGQPLPNIEDPAAPIQNERSRPVPAGVAPIMRHWAPRKAHAGTHDEAWLRERLPLAPLDFDDRHNLCAAPELVYPGYLAGGEEVSLYNLCEHGALRFALPRLSFFVGANSAGVTTEHRPVLDTLLLEPNDLAFEMVFRTHVPQLGRAHELRSIQVHERKVLS